MTSLDEYRALLGEEVVAEARRVAAEAPPLPERVRKEVAALLWPAETDPAQVVDPPAA